MFRQLCLAHCQSQNDVVREIKKKLGYATVYRNIAGEEDIYVLNLAVSRYSVHFDAQNVPLNTNFGLVDG